MKQLVTRAIVLNRTDFGEADRILTVLTPEYGKLSLLARGVRRVKSKLAGGIELFSISQITFMKGRGELGTLVSSRLETHYGHIVEHLDRTMMGYELIKRLHRITEDQPEPEYFGILAEVFAALDQSQVDIALIELWFTAKILQLSGHLPDLHHDNQGQTLQADTYYLFDYESMCFVAAPDNGQFGSNHIKLLRLAVHTTSPRLLAHVQTASQLAASLNLLLGRIQKQVS